MKEVCVQCRGVPPAGRYHSEEGRATPHNSHPPWFTEFPLAKKDTCEPMPSWLCSSPAMCFLSHCTIKTRDTATQSSSEGGRWSLLNMDVSVFIPQCHFVGESAYVLAGHAHPECPALRSLRFTRCQLVSLLWEIGKKPVPHKSQSTSSEHPLFLCTKYDGTFQPRCDKLMKASSLGGCHFWPWWP